MEKDHAMMRNIRFKSLACCVGLLMSSHYTFAEQGSLQALSDSEMSQVEGQALMSLSYLAPTDSTNPMKNISGNNNIGFYKLGLEAEIELNANIKNLQLGCGGVNGAGACDIDIKNLALSGLPDSYDSNGIPVYNDGRPSTSGKLTNPFIEFAISNPGSAATREVKGLRFSAEKISALLSAGLQNDANPSTTDGIQRLSGFLQVAGTSGTAFTQQTTFGLVSNDAGAKSNDQQLQGVAELTACLSPFCILPIRDEIKFTSRTNDPDSKGVTVPSVDVNFNLDPFVINGKRQTQAVLTNIKARLDAIPIAANGNPLYPASMFVNDQLRVDLSCDIPSAGLVCSGITALKPNAKFKMADGSAINNINLNIDFEQSLSMFHNIPLTGTGGYLSLQSIPMLWPGAKVASSDLNKNSLLGMSQNTDVAQTGWWMSFSEPVQLGKLNVTQPIVLNNDILKQVAQRATETLMQVGPETPKAEAKGLSELLALLADQPLKSKIVVDLNSSTLINPVYVQLQNQQLGNQKVISNCYGSLKFC